MTSAPTPSVSSSTPPNSIYTDDVDVETGGAGAVLSITRDHIAFQGCSTAAVENLFERLGSDDLQAVANLMIETKRLNSASASTGEAVATLAIMPTEVSKDHKNAFSVFSSPVASGVIYTALKGLNDGGVALNEFVGGWNTISLKGLSMKHPSFDAETKEHSTCALTIFQDLDKDEDGKLSLSEVVTGVLMGIKQSETATKTKKKMIWVLIILSVGILISIFVAVSASKDTSVVDNMLAVKGTNTPVETAVHKTILHLGQPAGEVTAVSGGGNDAKATAPQGMTTKNLGCMTLEEINMLRDNSLVVPATIETEDGGLHTLMTHDWEVDDVGDVKITDSSGFHYEIKPDSSCSSQVKHGRLLQVVSSNMDTEMVYMISQGINVGLYSSGCLNTAVLNLDLNNTILGNDADNVLYGGAGIDGIAGMAGADTIYGGDDNDTLNGGDGADILHGGTGSNMINGQEGIDKAVYPGLKVDHTFYYGTKVVANDLLRSMLIVKPDQGVDKLLDVEKLEFVDYECVIDWSVCGSGAISSNEIPCPAIDADVGVFSIPTECYSGAESDIPGCLVCECRVPGGKLC